MLLPNDPVQFADSIGGAAGSVDQGLGLPLRHKVSGSDLFGPLMARCAREGLPVFFVGGTSETCRVAMRRLQREHPMIRITGCDPSRFDLERDPAHALAVLRRARDGGARLIVVCLPALKQMMLSRFEDEYRPALGIGAGAALSFAGVGLVALGAGGEVGGDAAGILFGILAAASWAVYSILITPLMARYSPSRISASPGFTLRTLVKRNSCFQSWSLQCGSSKPTPAVARSAKPAPAQKASAAKPAAKRPATTVVACSRLQTSGVSIVTEPASSAA